MAKAPIEEKPCDYAKCYRSIQFQDLARFVRDYPNKDGIRVYVYRVHPVIDRRLSGSKNNYIEVFDTPFELTEHEVFTRYGSGKYKVQINDINQPSAKNRANCVFSLNDPDYPAKFNPVELVLDDPENRSTVDRLKATGALPNTAADQEETMKAESNNAFMLKLLEHALKPPAPVVEPRQSKRDSDESFTKMLFEENASLRELVFERATAAPAPVDALKQAEQTIAIIDKLRGSGGGVSPGDSGPEKWIEVFKVAAPVVGSIVLGIRDALTARSPVYQPTPPPGFYPPQPVAQPIPQPVAQTSNPFTIPELENPEMFGIPVALYAAMKKQVPRAFEAFKMDIEGDAFAFAMCKTPVGEADYNEIAGLGYDGLKTALTMVPDLAAQLSAMGKTQDDLEAWLRSFLTYGEPEDETPDTTKAAA